MKEELYKKFYEGFEENHWWFSARRKIILDQLESTVKDQKKKLKILDIGCGTGFMFNCLQKYGEVWGVDSSTKAIKFCKERGIKNLLLNDATRLPFNSEEFDLVAMLDVLEHIDDDSKALEEIKRVLKSNGIGIITVPAFKFLWSSHDEESGHFRRYTRKSLKNKLNSNRFEISKITYFNLILFPIVVFVRIVKNIIKRFYGVQSDLVMYPRPINSLLRNIFAFESILLNYISLPYGSSILVVFKKAEKEKAEISS